MKFEESQDLDQHPIATDVDLIGSVPVVDFAPLASGSVPESAVERIAQACRDWGFFQIVNHGISEHLIAAVWKQTQQFFALPIEIKESILRSKNNPWGYYNNELTKNQRDKKEVFDFTRPGVDPIYAAQNRWLGDLPEFEAVMLEYYQACCKLSEQLLQAFCRGLGMPASSLHSDFDNNHTGFVRLNYYPVDDPMKGSKFKANSDAGLGIHHHTDAGAFTILLQDQVGGLQVHREGYWYDIPPIKGSLVINTGDMMQVWSNDVYKAALHRVQAMQTSNRFSIPFFVNPSAKAQVSPLSSMVSAERPERYHPIDWAQFRGKRSEGDYADYGAEIQIVEYRI